MVSFFSRHEPGGNFQIILLGADDPVVLQTTTTGVPGHTIYGEGQGCSPLQNIAIAGRNVKSCKCDYDDGSECLLIGSTHI